MMRSHSSEHIRDFFSWSNWLDHMALRPLSHIAPNWEIRWDHGEKRYKPERLSFAADLNHVIELIAICPPPVKYHDHEDALAEWVVRDLKWPIQKKGGRWVGADYATILERGAFHDLDQENLIAAVAGRVRAALDHGQKHVDDMEEGHLHILAALLSIIIYYRYCDGTSLLVEVDDEDGAT